MAFTIGTVDKSKQQEGVWEEFEGSEFLIAYAQNPTFLREKERLERPFKRQIERNKLSGEEHKRILCKALAAGVLLDWRGVTDGTKEIEYDQEIAAQEMLYRGILIGLKKKICFGAYMKRLERCHKPFSKSLRLMAGQVGI